MQNSPEVWHGTTILTVRKNGLVAIGGDGQVTLGPVVMKSDAKKIRRLHGGEVLGRLRRGVRRRLRPARALRGQAKTFQGSVPRAATELGKGLAHGPLRCAASKR